MTRLKYYLHMYFRNYQRKAKDPWDAFDWLKYEGLNHLFDVDFRNGQSKYLFFRKTRDN